MDYSQGKVIDEASAEDTVVQVAEQSNSQRSADCFQSSFQFHWDD
jgi:hypothetical protein